jgi:hypothetical protein
MDEASAKACEIAKTQISKQPKCTEENAKISGVDCADKAARKAADYMTLNSECMKKVREGAKAEGEEAKKELKEEKAKAEEKKAEEKKDVTCKAVDASGASIAEAIAPTQVKCTGDLGKKVRESCTEADAGKKKDYEVVATVGEKEKKSKGQITCPKAKKK